MLTCTSTRRFAKIWVPVNVYKNFEDAFGLVYDEVTDLYIVDYILHQILPELKPSVIFTLRNAAGSKSAETVQDTLPYGAFDL